MPVSSRARSANLERPCRPDDGTRAVPDTTADLAPTRVVVIGAGPAGLTAAHQLLSGDIPPSIDVLEADHVVGGISRTVERDGWRFDIGGHRFFTKVQRVDDLWHEILGPDDFLLRPRMSRIHYRGKFFDYPLRATNALFGLGIGRSIMCVLSYLWVRVRPPRDQSTFEGWVAARFGWRLYRIFFKTYTEKVWGVPATQIQADWAAQRIKSLSLGKAIVNALLPRRNQTEVTSLIEEFQYPKYGPGMMWEKCADLVRARGGRVHLDSPVTRIERNGTLRVHSPNGVIDCDHIVSSMPIGELIAALDPPAPENVRAAAASLKHRDFLTVALVVPEHLAFPDNWIYIHSPHVRVGRVQNYGSWSPYMVKEGRTCLGLEYFVTEGDDLWTADDDWLVDFASRELEALSLVPIGVVESGHVVRMPKAYPVYDRDYAANVAVIREWLERELPTIHPVGRNGMHRYNNQDHSMMTAMLAAENVATHAGHDVWSVNVDDEYHEESSTGRAAPVTG